MTDLLAKNLADDLSNEADLESETISPVKFPDHTVETVVQLLSEADTSRSSWVGDALCGGKTHLFFAPPGERRTRRTKREALAMSYCLQCPVMQECRTWARENRESGFWGAENEEQRAAAGFAPKSPNRRAVADAARIARENA